MKSSHAILLYAGIASILLAGHAISQEANPSPAPTYEIQKPQSGGVMIRFTDQVENDAIDTDIDDVVPDPFRDEPSNINGKNQQQSSRKRATSNSATQTKSNSQPANQPEISELPQPNANRLRQPGSKNAQNGSNGNGNDIVARGRVAFQDSCVDCHEAERATSEKKTKSQWLVTIRRMAALEDADIDPLDFEPIATYLASLEVTPKAEGENGSSNQKNADGSKKDDSSAKGGGAKQDDDGEKKDDASAEGEDDSSDEKKSGQRRSAFDPQVVARGRTAFQSSCTKCHDAQRSLSKKKSKAGWLATVRRMARLDGADVASADFVPIATYLASLSAPAQAMSTGGDGDDSSGMDAAADVDFADEGAFGSGLNISATISTLFRGGNDNLENPGFFVDAWLRADWQPDGPIRGRVTACTSCHSDQTNDGGFTLELVEATAHLDLMHAIKKDCPVECQPKLEAEIKAGRFVVPFGAFASMSHPGVYRTVTNPLMYNMGRQVNADRSFPPVLPAPFSDEGVDLLIKFPVLCDWNVTMDLYGINGLQGGGAGVQFTPSRSYADNNNHPTIGGRATLGNGQFRFGGSIMSGRMHDDAASPLHYRLVGGDATAYFIDDLVRVYFEYAIRTNGSVLPEDQIAYGIVSEVEALLIKEPNLSFLARYDTLEHRNFFGDTSIERFTWGFSTTALGGSLFMINHEHWNFPTDEKDVDVVGFRWVATF